MTRPMTQRPPDKAADQWIDTFRDVFLRDDSGVRVLTFLAAKWGFFNRKLDTEEKRVQRQCFMDLMICCGVFENDTAEQLIRLLLVQPEPPKSSANGAWKWLLDWKRVRTRRIDQVAPPVQNTERNTT